MEPETHRRLACLRHNPLKGKLGCTQARRGSQSHTQALICAHIQVHKFPRRSDKMVGVMYSFHIVVHKN